MKTVLINIFDKGVIKNIIKSDLPRILNNVGIKIVILVHPNHFEKYKKEFASDMLIVDKRPWQLESKFEAIASFIARNSIPAMYTRLTQKNGVDGSGRTFLHRYIVATIAWYLGRFRWFKKLIGLIFPFFYNYHLYDEVIKKYNPDLIFSPTIFTINDFRILRYSKKYKIPTIGIIKSWDNLTNKDPLLIWPDWLVVHGEITKREAIEMHNYPEDKILISGIPSMDVYSRKDIFIPKEKFFKSLSLDPKKKLITYVATGSWQITHELEIIKMLADIVNSDELDYPSQLLVRFHPAYTSYDEEVRLIPNVIVDRPGEGDLQGPNKWKIYWKFTDKYLKHIASTLLWSDMIINCGSSIIIEAAIFDKPVMNIGFDGGVEEKNPWRSVLKYMSREHLVYITKTGGAPLILNRESLVKTMNAYLKDPSLHKEGRKRIAREQNYKSDGKANERIANFIIKKLNEVTAR